jgi:hypothetical protein
MNDRHRQRKKILQGNYDLLILHLVALLDEETKQQIRQSVKRLVRESEDL